MFLLALAAVIATPDTLAGVIAAANPGERITLAPGDYAPFGIRNRVWSPPLTIDATQGRMVRAAIERVDGLTLIGGHWTGALGVGRSGQSIAVSHGRNVQLIGGTYSEAQEVGIAIGASQDVLVRGATITRMKSDGINIVASRGVTIEDVTCSDFEPKPRAHPDCIQSWSVLTAPPNADIAIRRVTSIGRMQGIFFGNPEKGGFDRVTITGNRIASTYYNGIGLWNCRDCTVSDNDLSPLPGATTQSIVRLNGGSVTSRRNRIGVFKR